MAFGASNDVVFSLRKCDVCPVKAVLQEQEVPFSAQ